MLDQIVQVGNVCPTKTRSNPNQGRVYDPNGISPTLSCMGGGNLEPHIIIYNDYSRRGVSDVSISKTSEKFRVRKLTPKECWRLMGFEDKDFENARNRMNENLYNGNDRSSSQLYKQAGNSIVVDVLSAIMGELYNAMPCLFEDMVVGSFFSGIGAFEKALSTFDSLDNSNKFNYCHNRELKQIGYINDYNGDANRVYDGDGISRALKVEAGGGGTKTGWYSVPSPTEAEPIPQTLCINSKVNGKQPSLSKRIYDPKGVATAVTTGDFFMPTYLIPSDNHGKGTN